ncbi:MAG: DeoR/GlpR transcriptional regulator [Coraliomargarita sp. TMED73]|jgi:DeoR/GlpR family transcriptional regulator of sugar metabolism|nr:MAG: DeoR/GlpR transcriptional regulator [Coraliomargarita sp. TMED73]RPG87165.1 MAG: DeoR/GlpR transcriptional regulator [Coraliomargarita sp. TMED73]|tara:strand:- start:743 stop:1510 length:768 start_codon:yes stop_codon:yes gene_type:complete
MLAQERQNHIVSMLEERGTVRTIDLATEFAVTDETIRRDLQTLAESNQLTRIHGGACSRSGRPRLQSFSERSSLNIPNKQAIAQAAMEWIHPGRTYAFDSSTTAFALVSALPDLPYRVVTNAFGVLQQLVSMQNVQVISTGGGYHPKTHTFVGNDSTETLRRHHIHTAFISSIGFDLKRGASEGFEEQASYKERLLQYAEEVVLLIDSSKFQQRSEYYFAGIRDIDHIITDSGISEALARDIRSTGLILTIADKS